MTSISNQNQVEVCYGSASVWSGHLIELHSLQCRKSAGGDERSATLLTNLLLPGILSSNNIDLNLGLADGCVPIY